MAQTPQAPARSGPGSTRCTDAGVLSRYPVGCLPQRNVNGPGTIPDFATLGPQGATGPSVHPYPPGPWPLLRSAQIWDWGCPKCRKVNPTHGERFAQRHRPRRRPPPRRGRGRCSGLGLGTDPELPQGQFYARFEFRATPPAPDRRHAGSRWLASQAPWVGRKTRVAARSTSRAAKGSFHEVSGGTELGARAVGARAAALGCVVMIWGCAGAYACGAPIQSKTEIGPLAFLKNVTVGDRSVVVNSGNAAVHNGGVEFPLGNVARRHLAVAINFPASTENGDAWSVIIRQSEIICLGHRVLTGLTQPATAPASPRQPVPRSCPHVCPASAVAPRSCS
jgi:hypothetical protein